VKLAECNSTNKRSELPTSRGVGYPFLGVSGGIARPWWKLEWPVIALMLLPIVILGRSLFPGRVFSAADNVFRISPWYWLDPGVTPQNPLLMDRTVVFEPWLIYARRQVERGMFPLWNVHSFTGAPFLGNFQSALLFPFNELAYVVPIRTALGLAAILKLATAGLSMYWMLRVFSLEPMAATAGALAFMLNGSIIAWLGWPNTNVVIWIPLLIGLTTQLRETGACRYAGWLALVVGVQFLGGHPETSFFILVLTGCYALFGAPGPGVMRFVIQSATAAGIGGLIAAVQILPFFHYLASSSAVLFRQQTHFVWVLPVRAIIALFIPNYFGNPTSGNFWGPINFNAISGSVGMLPWILMPCALLGGWDRREVKFFLGAAIFIGLAVYNGRPVPWLLSKLPGFSLAVNMFSLIVLPFCLAALCGFGMQILLRPPLDRRLRMIRGIELLFLLLLVIVACYLIADVRTILHQGLAIYVALQSGAFVILLALGTGISISALQRGANETKLGMGLLAIELLNLLLLAFSYNPVIRSKQFYPTTPALKFLQAEHGLFRVHLTVPNVGAVYGLSDVSGYDAMTPRYLEQLVEPPGALLKTGGGKLLFNEHWIPQLFNLLNLKYILVAPGSASPAPGFRLVYDGADGRIYQNMSVFPRVFLVPVARTCLDDAAALALIRSGKIDLRREVIISGCRQLISGVSPSGNLTVEQYGPQRIDVRARVENPAFLVLTDTYDSDWCVWLDNRPVPLLRADYAFRAVALGPGTHKIQFRYRPLTVVVGLALSIIGLISSVVLIWL
jgi:Bacterial membrane protein YfhO